MKATRVAYGEALAEFGSNERIVVLDADLSKSTMTDSFKKVYPERFINCGIAEGNMVAVAAGLAAAGNIAFASSFAVFASGRAFEQIRNSVCYPKLNVKIGATHAGISVGEDGASHQSVADLALMRALPNMTVFSPCDAYEARAAVKAAIDIDGPCYLRFSRLNSPYINAEGYELTVGKGVTLREGGDVTIIATGLMVAEALAAHDLLKEKGVNARIVNMHTIKPIDTDIIVKAAQDTGLVVTVEEHSIIGGLGGAVAEVLCEQSPCRLVRMGLNDTFGKSGKPADLMEYYGLTAKHIAERVIKAKA